MYLLQNGLTPNLVFTNVYVKRVGTLFVAIFYMYMIVLLSQMIIKKLLPQTKSLIYVEFEMTKMQEIEILFWYSH
jgi:hypothetical protein